MSTPPDTADELRAAAARWTVRRDRGLSASESIEFELWLAADPRHAAALQRSAGTWARLDRMPESAAQAALVRAARRRTWWRRAALAGSLAAAAAVAIMTVPWDRRPAAGPAAAPALVAAGPRAVTLADGTLARLNAGSEIVEQFTTAERNVKLTRGEAHFTVTRNPARPFVVSAGEFRVRAVGTAFNVDLQSTGIAVLVTEGKVGVERVDRDAPPRPGVEPLHVVAGELAVALAAPASGRAPAITVTPVDATAMAQAIAWHDSLLRLGGATLAEIAAEFERRTGHRVNIPDADLAALRVGGRFRADDPAGFAHLLAATFDITVERAADGTLVLRKNSQVRDSGK